MQSSLEILDDDKLDREWVVRNVLGGMAAGFGLRGMANTLDVFLPDSDISGVGY